MPAWYAAAVGGDGALARWYPLGGEDADELAPVGTAAAGSLYTVSGVLRRIDLRTGEVLAVGHVGGAAAMAVLCDRVYAVDDYGRLVSWPLLDPRGTWVEGSRVYEADSQGSTPKVLFVHDGLLAFANGASNFWTTTPTTD